MNFTIRQTPITGLVVIEPRAFGDVRGFFMETYRRDQFARFGIEHEFVQDNHSRSQKGTLRGLHFQRRRPQAKLVRALRGRVFDVAIDLRPASPTFARWHGVELSEENRLEFYIPAGFAHGFLALTDGAEIAYKCSDYYDADDEGGLRYDDPRVGIAWPLEGVGEPLLSEKDRALPYLDQLERDLLGDRR